jgi:FkbM family methyltransferase
MQNICADILFGFRALKNYQDTVHSSFWSHLKYYLTHKPKPHDSIGFFKENTDKVNTIANLLADEKSKNIYLGLIKYYRTGKRKYYPFYKIEEEQYYLKQLTFNDDEVYIDCGALGNTIDRFIKHCPNYKQIVGFEPLVRYFNELKKKHEDNPKITLYNKGVYDYDGDITLYKMANTVSTDNTLFGGGSEGFTIKVITIDSLSLEKVTFIKMDIEGSEINALKGAEKTILRDKPKLAICLYHSHQDMIRIPEYIHNLVPEYKLYVRQYDLFSETVLYATL